MTEPTKTSERVLIVGEPRSARVPVIDKINHRIGTLERRQIHLQHRLDTQTGTNYTGSAAAEFDRAEVAALNAAILALQYIRDRSER